MFHVNKFLTLCLLAPAALAAPRADRSASLAKRDIPNCQDTSSSYSGSYTDGQGTYVTSDNITHPYKFPLIRKCWWDYFVVTTALQELAWEKSSGDIYCSGTSSCTATQLNATQVCKGSSSGVSVSVGAELEGVTLGVSFESSTESSTCYTATDSTACTWNDAACHTVWSQQQVFVQTGYMRHRCNYGNGDTTECMADWTQTVPTGQVNYGCGSACSDTNTCGNTNGQPCS